ncbi:MAG: DNA methyltransferase, partial [Nocardioidaceae bacterium]
EKRATIPARVAKTVEIVSGWLTEPGEQAIVYCHLNDEQRTLERALTAVGISFSSIDGSMATTEVERRLAEWKDRRTAVLLGKPVMLGVGLNLQQCNKMIFAGIDYRFHDTIQACHRIHRFGQTRSCEVHLIHAESEREILRVLMAKWRQHTDLTGTMSELIREHGLSRESVEGALTRSLGVERVEVSGDDWTLVNNDCVPEVASMPDESAGLIVTSIPFSNHYEYTPAYEDLGFTDSNEHFWAQMDFLTPQLLRVLQPGRVYCCHVKDRILFGHVTSAGVPTVSPFHAEAITHAIAHGFDYLGMITVVTDVVRENNQTYRLGWSEQCKDGTKMGVGSPEYVLLFHKPQSDRSKGYADVPVVKDKAEYSRSRWQTDAHAFWRSSGDRHLTTDELAAMGPDQLAKLFTEQSLQQVYDYESHVRIGEALDGRGSLPSTFMALAPGSHHPMVWHDVNRMRTLNGEQSMRGLVQHICPLQIDIVDRLIVRYSNPDDLVLDPFSGLGTVPVRALHHGRRGLGVELNPGYFLDAVKYCEAVERERGMPTLFDALDGEFAEVAS